MTYVKDKYRMAAIAKVKIGLKQLGIDKAKDQELYETTLFNLVGHKSLADMSMPDMDKVIDHLKSSGCVFTHKKHGKKPHNIESSSDSAPKLKKIEALLSEMGKPWKYANTTVKNMFGKDDITFCTQKELLKVIAALQIHANRKKGGKDEA